MLTIILYSLASSKYFCPRPIYLTVIKPVSAE
jgi:hypothetical protein